jgi:hypothetical protein
MVQEHKIYTTLENTLIVEPLDTFGGRADDDLCTVNNVATTRTNGIGGYLHHITQPRQIHQRHNNCRKHGIVFETVIAGLRPNRFLNGGAEKDRGVAYIPAEFEADFGFVSGQEGSDVSAFELAHVHQVGAGCELVYSGENGRGVVAKRCQRGARESEDGLEQ